MIRSPMDDLYNVESLNELLNIGFLMSARCAYSRKKCWMFTLTANTNFPDLEISRRNIFGPALEIGYKEMFLITLVETIINIFSRHN